MSYADEMSETLLEQILQSLLRLEAQNAVIMTRLDDLETVQDQIADDMDIKRILKASMPEEIEIPTDATDLLKEFLAKKDG